MAFETRPGQMAAPQAERKNVCGAQPPFALRSRLFWRRLEAQGQLMSTATEVFGLSGDVLSRIEVNSL